MVKLWANTIFSPIKKPFLNYWDERVEESKNYESIYTLGMRGIHDSGMVGANTMQERVDALQDIITQQRLLLEKHVNNNASLVPQAFTAYKEVLDIYDEGMQLPEDITLVWPDDNYGYIQRFSDAETEKRIGGSGIYYHLSYWGRPHDYLWLCSTHPVLVWEEMIKASYFNSNKIWVVNVGDLKPLEYNISLFLDMAWNTNEFKSSTDIRKHFNKWHSDVFGQKCGGEIADLKWGYYDLNFERRPEFMGWSQTEPTRKTHFTEYNHFRAGDEAQKRIDAFDGLANRVNVAKHDIPQRLHDAYFQLVEYPVVSAGLINKKFLYMEKAYYYAWQNRLVANDLAVMSKVAYDSIQLYTDYYNKMGNGKWDGMMYMQPRSLPVFDIPGVPQWQFNTALKWGLATEGDEDIRRVKEVKGNLHLPTFNNLTKRSYFVDVFLKDNQPLEWKAEPTADWIKVSQPEGLITGAMGDKQHRVYISVDWDKVPAGNRFNGNVRFSGNDKNYSIGVTAIRQNPEIKDKHLFIEENGYISIFAENFNRVVNTENFGWDVIDGLGYTGKSVWVNPLKEKEKKYDAQLQNPSVLEYDIFANRGRDVTVTIYAIPVHPLNRKYSNSFAVAINNEEPVVVDHRTIGRSDEWKLNVLRNSAVITTKHTIPSAGHHTLKIFAIDPGVIIDRITIDFGGLIKTYSVLDETKVK